MNSTGPKFLKYIDGILIANAGTGYSSLNPPAIIIGPPNATTTSSGDRIQATATLEISSSAVDVVDVVEPGDGYNTIPDIYLIGSVHTTDTLSINFGGANNSDRISLAGTKIVDITSSMVTRSKEGGVVLTGDPQITFTINASGGIATASWYAAAGSTSGYGFAEDDIITLTDLQFGGTGTTGIFVLKVETITQGGSGAVLTGSVNYLNRQETYYHQNSTYLTEFQIPEWIRTEYPKYTDFIKTYFNFLDANGSTATELSLSSPSPNYILQELLDRFTVTHYHGDFLETLLQQYCLDFPLDKTVDTRLLIKRIRDFYSAKGSRKSIETFFRMVYGEEIEVFRPSEFILKASDGIWSKAVTTKVYQNEDVTPIINPLSLRGKEVFVYYYETVPSSSITVRKYISTSVLRAEKLAYTNPPAYELTINVPENTALPGYGVTAELVAVVGGNIATVTNIGASDALRDDSSSPYTITTTDYTTDGNGSLASFSVAVSAAGAATITVTGTGKDFAPGETITIPDNKLGSGGGAALTFDIGTITNGKIFSVTTTNVGQGYSANPLVVVVPNPLDTITTDATIETRLGALDGVGSSLSDTLITNAGLGYNLQPILLLDTLPLRSYIALPNTSDVIENKKAFLTRVLNTVMLKTNTASADGGFTVGDTFQISETGDILGVYALDYFAEAYTVTGIENKAYIRVKSIDTANYPATLEIIATGTGFQRNSFDFVLTSNNSETATISCKTGFSYTYPGKFKNSQGFLSDANRLQNNALYQSFSYQIKSSLPKSRWGELLTRSAHPAGMVAYADLQISHVVDLATTFSIVPDILVFRIFVEIDTVLVQDATALFVHKAGIADSFTTQDDEAFLEPGLVKAEDPTATEAIDKFDITVGKTDSADMVEIVAKAFEKNQITDSVDMSELVHVEFIIVRYLTDSVDMSESVAHLIQLNKTESVEMSEVVTRISEMVKSDPAGIADLVDTLEVGLPKTENPTMSDANTMNFGMNEPEDYTASDAGVLIVQNYAGDYFAEDYVGEARSF
tara:strand:- start:40263 stop:43352 length:3090 start_codon:yes stop_codon:yes gene_type:complete